MGQLHRVEYDFARFVSDADPGDHARIDDFRQFCLQALRQCAAVFPIPFENPQQNVRIPDRTADTFRQDHRQVAIGDISADFLVDQFPIRQIVRQAESGKYAQHHKPNNQQGSSPITIQAA